MSDTERDRMWQIVADIRNAYAPPDDADNDEIIDALIAAGFGDVTALRQNFEAQAESDNSLIDIAAKLVLERDARITALAAQVTAIKALHTQRAYDWTKDGMTHSQTDFPDRCSACGNLGGAWPFPAIGALASQPTPAAEEADQ